MKTKTTKQKETRKKIPVGKTWVALHWLGGDKRFFSSEKEARQYCKQNSFNPKSPLYYAYPVAGIFVVEHEIPSLVGAVSKMISANKEFVKTLAELGYEMKK